MEILAKFERRDSVVQTLPDWVDRRGECVHHLVGREDLGYNGNYQVFQHHRDNAIPAVFHLLESSMIQQALIRRRGKRGKCTSGKNRLFDKHSYTCTSMWIPYGKLGICHSRPLRSSIHWFWRCKNPSRSSELWKWPTTPRKLWASFRESCVQFIWRLGSGTCDIDGSSLLHVVIRCGLLKRAADGISTGAWRHPLRNCNIQYGENGVR